MPGGRLLFPAFPQRRLLPWLLAGGGLAVLIYGLIEGDTVTAVLGGGALAAAVVAFPLARLVLGPPPGTDSAEEGAGHGEGPQHRPEDGS